MNAADEQSIIELRLWSLRFSFLYQRSSKLFEFRHQRGDNAYRIIPDEIHGVPHGTNSIRSSTLTLRPVWLVAAFIILVSIPILFGQIRVA
jgi:hypothetical protein